MNNLIIGSGSISKSLEDNLNLQGKSVEVIPLRLFFNNFAKKTFDFQRFDRIFLIGIDKSNLLKNLFNTISLIKQLNKHSWNGRLYFFSTQQTLKIFRDKDGKKISSLRGYYGWIKQFQSRLIEYLSKFKFHIIYLPYVIGENTNWQKYFLNLSRKKILYLPENGNSLIAVCNVNKMAKYLINNNLRSHEYIFFSEILSLEKCIEKFSVNNMPKIQNVDFSLKEKCIWTAKNSFIYIFMQICRDLILLNKASIQKKLHVKYSKEDVYKASLQEKYNFSLNFSSDSVSNACIIKL